MWFKCKVHIRHAPNNLYAATAGISSSCGPLGHVWRNRAITAIQSRGPWLASGLCCPTGSSLTMASSETLAPSAALSASSSRPCPTTLSGLVTRTSPIYSVCLSLRAAFRTPAFRVVAPDCSFTTRSGLRHLSTGSAPASHAVGSRMGRVTRLQSSLYATARRVACPSPTGAFTFELSPPESPTRRRRISLHGQTVNSRDRTFTGKTHSIMGCELRITKHTEKAFYYALCVPLFVVRKTQAINLLICCWVRGRGLPRWWARARVRAVCSRISRRR